MAYSNRLPRVLLGRTAEARTAAPAAIAGDAEPPPVADQTRIGRMDYIRIRGARTHNLKNVNLDLPRDKLIVITGLSGSGKSSLAFDTLYAEGQRRYVESLSAYARQFLQLMEKPDVDLIEGLSPAISIEQKATSHNPRSTVGTVTEIHDYLRLLFARVGDPYCPDHRSSSSRRRRSRRWSTRRSRCPRTPGSMVLAPVVVNRKGEQAELFIELRAQGLRARAHRRHDARDRRHAEARKTTKHTIEVVVDRLKVRADMKQRLAESFETALRHGDGARDRARDRHRPRAPVLGQVRLPGLQLRAGRARAAAVLVQQSGRRLPALRRPRRDQFFDPKRVVAFPQLSLASGAIKGWDRRNQFYFQMLQSLAKHYRFDLEKPFAKLPERRADADPRRQRRGGGAVRLPVRARPRRGPRAPVRGHDARTSSAATARPTR